MNATVVGGRRLDVPDVIQGVDVPTWLLYPADDASIARETTHTFGAYELSFAEDAPIDGAPGPLPLVVISHGRSSTPWVFRGLALALARAGFAVALPEHLGNSRTDNSLDGTVTNLENRPRHIRLVIDALPMVERRRVAVLGHSIGAYTALAAAGGKPMSGPFDQPAQPPRAIAVTPDPRIGALVLLAPATPWFREPGSLADVRASILMLAGERDELAPPTFHAQNVVRELAEGGRLDYRVIPGAGHFSFQSPFPPAMVRPDFPPSQDPPGFDRAAFAPELAAAITGFLRRALDVPAI